jgi:Tol biopolymer transport system component
MIAAGVRTPANQIEPTDQLADIWIVPTNNEPPTVLENAYQNLSWRWSDLEWSPDGKVLAISQHQLITLYSLADSESRTLDGTDWAKSLTWSPDGTRIIYESRYGPWSSPSNYLRVVEVDGTGGYTLASDYDSVYGLGPGWSPAGDQILYERECLEPDGEACPHEDEVVLVTLQGDQVVLPDLRLPGEDQIWRPHRVAWSPDGSHLLYLAWVGPPSNYVQDPVPQALIARPIDPGSPPVVLYQPPTIVSWGADFNTYGEGFQLASQSWARPVLP